MLALTDHFFNFLPCRSLESAAKNAYCRLTLRLIRLHVSDINEGS